MIRLASKSSLAVTGGQCGYTAGMCQRRDLMSSLRKFETRNGKTVHQVKVLVANPAA